MGPVSTFSLVARDPETGDLGVAVASKFLAVGAVVPYAKAGVGAVATQSYANTSFGPKALAILEAGGSPEACLEAFRRTDPELPLRQFGIVAASGESLTFTGEGCHPWAGGEAGENYAAQGNLLTGPEVVQAMVEAFKHHATLPFPERLVKALLAGDRAGGDKRGRQSAALLVVGEGKGYGGLSDRWIDLRVDDHPDPVAELERLLSVHRLLFTRPESRRPLQEAEIRWLQALLKREGYYTGPVTGAWDEATEAAFRALIGVENLEERYAGGAEIDDGTLTYLRQKYT
ncbi:DUF1028 domain-containing protein [Marinithermus hydrothermalis]|uniref:Putative peptidoglycan binding domain-containing protein n=1 Tax=Marinithermus hydrothermalis (strain DSM 14884 / JCM 11576 / T1) TaxID=869210 RepID=F2NQ70_MARHT|nr:DUF1028 domain-containing protein [Marinithermus hydrothermalis]AEB11381.1 protein of unknown function DUF1028 [Marinithermus hydrothermalis DSM 14884]